MFDMKVVDLHNHLLMSFDAKQYVKLIKRR